MTDRKKFLSNKEDRRPADLWFWDDWFSSFDARSCSLAAQGLWINMLGIMRSASVKGLLSINGKKAHSKDIAKLMGTSQEEIDVLLKELEDKGVFSRLRDGTIYNRRMYRESQIRLSRSRAGKKGAERRWQKDANAIGTPMANVEDGNEYEDKDKNIKAVKFSEIDIKLTDLFINLMLKNNPKSSIIKRINPTRRAKWINKIRLIRERDGRSPEEIESVIKFSQGDDFWKGNILSTANLREKFDQLWLKSQKKPVGKKIETPEEYKEYQQRALYGDKEYEERKREGRLPK